MRSLFIAAAAALILSWPALAHGPAQWIQDGGYRNADGALCCGESDCIELATEDVATVGGGYYIKSLKEFIPNAEATPSPDGHYWRCAWPTPTDRKCFFFPPPSI